MRRDDRIVPVYHIRMFASTLAEIAAKLPSSVKYRMGKLKPLYTRAMRLDGREKTIMLRNSLCLALLLCSTRMMLGQTRASGAGASPVPTVIKFSSTIQDLEGRELSGSRGLTVAPYRNQGRYTVFSGSTSLGGIPPELFASGETQWIDVTPDDGIERPRFPITTVPYAFKAAEADTLGGARPEECVSVQ